MKKILVLGGTMFIGRSFVERLKLLPGYDITLFNRGKSNTGLFEDIKQIHGNRETEDIQKIYSTSWDCIIDFSGYYPNTFEKLLAGLKGKVGRYIFISTISVYDLEKLAGKPITEKDETYACSESQKTSKLPDAYGEKKAEMERILFKQDWLDKIIFRPSFIYGKYDWTERFYYWLYRAKFSNKILIPDGGAPFKLSFTNSDDLTEALLMAVDIEKHHTTYNAVSQPVSTLRELISITAKALDRHPEIVSLDSAQLEKLKLKPSDFPLFVPLNFTVDDKLWMQDFPFKRADIGGTFSDMLNYKSTNNFPKPPFGLDFGREQEIIAANF